MSSSPGRGRAGPGGRPPEPPLAQGHASSSCGLGPVGCGSDPSVVCHRNVRPSHYSGTHRGARRESRWAGEEISVAGNPVVLDVLQTVASTLTGQTGRATLDIVDAGGGTGGFAVPLASLGHHVTVVDPSPDSLAAAQRRAAEQ